MQEGQAVNACANAMDGFSFVNGILTKRPKG